MNFATLRNFQRRLIPAPFETARHRLCFFCGMKDLIDSVIAQVNEHRELKAPETGSRAVEEALFREARVALAALLEVSHGKTNSDRR